MPLNLEPLEPRTLLSTIPVPLRINAGGPALIDSLARPFAADSSFSGGQAIPAPAGTTADTALFASYRTGHAFTFSRPVPNGHYNLFLEFADPTSTAPGQRTFDVSAEGALRLDDLDVFKEAAAPAAPVAKSLDVTITDGRLDLAFTGVAGDAIVSAIVLVPTDVPTAARPYVRDRGLYDESTIYGWARNEALKTYAASYLRQLGWGLMTYSDHHKGTLPPDLTAIAAPPYDVSLEAFQDPRTDTGLPRGELSALEQVGWVASLDDFVYLGAGKRLSQLGGNTPLAYEDPDRVVGGINVLMSDLGVRYFDRADAAALLGFPNADPAHAPAPQDPLDPALRGDPRVQASASNLRQIGQAMQAYTYQNRGGFFPVTLSLLNGFTPDGPTPQTFVNPRGSTTPPPADLPPDAAAAWIDASTDYVYLASGKRNTVPSTTLLAFENPAEMTVGLNLLFSDGHVEFREFRWALETIARAGATTRLPKPGDATRDNTVNFDDLLTLARNYNKTNQPFTAGDFNYDGTVNFDDLLLLARNYTATTATAAPSVAAVFPTTTTTKSKKPEVLTTTVRSPAPIAKPKPAPARKPR